jgi:hypothetical protein
MFARYASKSANVAFARSGVLCFGAAGSVASTASRVVLTRSRRAAAGGQSTPI